ncbi:MAG: sensor histidine kinase, partial [Solirubrobacterales bacterium]
FWIGDGLVWPALIAAVGVGLIWRRSTRADRADAHDAGDSASVGHRLSPALAEMLGRGGERGILTRPDRATLLRLAVGAALVVVGLAAFAAALDAFQAAGNGVVALLIVVAGLALVFGPWIVRLVSELSAERRERIRSQERAEVAAHLHDSVLQTLALIQRRADDPEATVKLARRQERELRSWLYGDGAAAVDGSIAGALNVAAAEVEDVHGVPVEVVTVGDGELDPGAVALVQAAREAMMNAARLSGASSVDAYLEVEEGRITCFVRDRGTGFDLAAIPADRHGVTDSIIGRMARHGGSADVRTAPGDGTEVKLTIVRVADAPANGETN